MIVSLNRKQIYYSIFIMLGGFGLILGTIGLEIIVVCNILERHGELGLLRAVGFSRKSIQIIVLSEQLFLQMIDVTLSCFAGLDVSRGLMFLTPL